MEIKISKDFSETPSGARLRKDGKFTGEEFREDCLVPAYEKAIEKSEKLTIDLDGGYGYPTSFLDEAFGGLARKYGISEVLEVLCFVSNDEPALVDEINNYIQNANKERKHEQSKAKELECSN